jgi:hypothetical protein
MIYGTASLSFLTSIRGPDYHFFAMGGIDDELNGTGNASPEKKKILSLNICH